MSALDLLRSQNSIEHVPSPLRSVSEGAVGSADCGPELAPPLAASTPNGTAPSGGPALPAVAPLLAAPAKADPPGIQAQYYIENAGKERRYYKDLEGKQLAFRADGKALTTRQEDRLTVGHMLDVAQARGWASLHVRGSAAFKQEAWIEAQARGLSVKGYDPTGDDRRNVQARRAARQRQPATTPRPVPDPNAVANATSTPAHVQASTPDPVPMVAPAASQSGPTLATTEKIALQVGNPTDTPAEGRNRTPAPAGASSVAGQGNRELDGTRGAQASSEPDASQQADAAAKLSPSGKRVLAFLEQRIDTQMARLGASVRADLRSHAARVLAKREAETGPVKVPASKPQRNRAAKRDHAADPQPDQARQPRMTG